MSKPNPFAKSGKDKEMKPKGKDAAGKKPSGFVPFAKGGMAKKKC